MKQKEYLLKHNQSQTQRDAVSKANSQRVWTEDMRKNLSNAMKNSYNKRKENKSPIVNG